MKGHPVALWSGVAAFFGSILAASVLDLLNTGTWVQYIAALFVAFFTGGLVYARERINDAKDEKKEDVV